MSTTRRILIAAGAPLVLAVGLAVVWGVRSAAKLKAQVEAWADSLEHSPNPVHIQAPFVPVYVDGRKIGKLAEVVVERTTPATVDSLRLTVATGSGVDAEALAACKVHLDPNAFDRNGPLGFRHALVCAADTNGLVRFGSVAFGGTDEVAPLYLAQGDLPCDHMKDPQAAGCTQVRVEIQRLRDELRRQADEIRFQVRHNVRSTVRTTVRRAPAAPVAPPAVRPDSGS